ncbi:hypothetical protein NDU88_008206 [Pleurodeles waltl]|uniref:Uncharacterized protein n=1 Tax=Pleurodeles waltl TaxID=8319 RepID=A0AAV7RSH7_PLEWA|nr:hypothetical protein NDU88_008206 [Pleurodeles waltl]
MSRAHAGVLLRQQSSRVDKRASRKELEEGLVEVVSASSINSPIVEASRLEPVVQLTVLGTCSIRVSKVG